MDKNTKSNKRQTRTRKKIQKISNKPRLSIFRSNKYCYAQVIDGSGNALFGVSEKTLRTKEKEKRTPMESAKQLGHTIAQMALEKKIKEVAFDKGRFAYHGRVKAIAEGARESGLQF